MFFGIVLSPTGWFFAGVIALLMVFAPFLAIEAIAEHFPEPLQTIIFIAGCYVIIPLIITYWYQYRFKKTGKGSAIFGIYCGFFALLFFITIFNLFSKPFTLNSIMEPLVTGAITVYMILVAIKTKKQVMEFYEEQSAIQKKIEREEAIQQQAQAILLAEKLKDKQGQE